MELMELNIIIGRLNSFKICSVMKKTIELMKKIDELVSRERFQTVPKQTNNQQNEQFETVPYEKNTMIHNRKRNRLQNYDYSAPRYYFVTICTKGMLEYFGRVQNCKMELNDAGRMVKK